MDRTAKPGQAGQQLLFLKWYRTLRWHCLKAGDVSTRGQPCKRGIKKESILVFVFRPKPGLTNPMLSDVHQSSLLNRHAQQGIPCRALVLRFVFANDPQLPYHRSMPCYRPPGSSLAAAAFPLRQPTLPQP
jgi:hypothetical protein